MYHHKYYMNEYEQILDTNLKNKSRLKKELRSFYERQTGEPLTRPSLEPIKDAYLININNISNKKYLIDFLLEIKTSFFVKVQLNIPIDYPFRCPNEVTINGCDYKHLLHINTNYLQKLGYGKTECLCCQSLCCKHIWYVQHNINDLLKEIHKNLNNKLRLREILMGEKIVEKYFGHYLPITEFL